MLDHTLRRFTRIVDGMVVYPERMRENLGRARAAWCSAGTVLLELARRGVSREEGSGVGAAQRDALVLTSSATSRALLLAD